MSAVMKGSKGGGNQPHASSEAADSLHSTARARILDLVSEGQILGFRHGGTNPLQDIYFNETPVANPDGSLNFTDVHIDSRAGSQAQSYMPGFAAVENEFSVGVELKDTAPWSQSITNLDLSAVRVRLAVPSLQQSNTSTGDITGYNIRYKIELSTDGGAWVQVVDSGFAGKTTSKYERTHRIDLPEATVGWTVRITRLTANKNLATVSDTTTVEAYTEIIDAKLRYPNSALVGVVIDAQQFPTIPSRSYDLYGRIISVPSNYNPTTRAYTGAWDGSFKPAWTDNPAWIFYDLATNKRFGLGRYVPASLMNKWALYEIAQYCDELVPDGRGGQEPRFTCTLYLQSQADAYKVLNDLVTIFRGQMYWMGGAIQAVADMPGDPDFTYSAANVIDGKFTYSGSGRKTRYTVALVSWNDPDDFGRAKVEPVTDRDGLARYGYQPTSVIAVGCTSRGQAQRMGWWILLTSRLETETVTFNVGMDGTVVYPGRIIRVQDPSRAGKRQAGRVHSATTMSVVVDRMPDLVAIGDTLTISTSDAVTETRTIAGIDGSTKTITVSVPFSEVPAPETVWLAESATLVAATYRVLSVKEPKSTDKELSYGLTALRHNASKFDAIDVGAAIEEPPITSIPPPSQLGPSTVVLSAVATKGQVLVGVLLTIQWTPALGAVRYRVEWRRDSGSWNRLPDQHGLSVDLPNAKPGTYEARVYAIGGGGNGSPPVYADSLMVDDPTTLPTTVEAIQQQADAAATDSSNALAQLAYIASDNTLAQGEKSLVLRDYSVITTEQAGIDAEAARYNITTEKTAYDNAISALTTYLATLTTPTAWNSISGDTDIIGTTWRSKWTAVYTARQTLLNKVLASAKANGDYAVNLGLTAPVVNPAFKNGLDNWTFDTNNSGEWAAGSGANTPDSAQSTFLIHNGVVGQTTTCAHNTGGIPVKTKQTVTAMVALRAIGVNAGARAYVRIGWRNSSGALISNSTKGVTICTGDAGSTYFTQGVSRVYGNAPDGAVSACVEVEIDGHTAGQFTITSAWLSAGHINADEIPESDIRKWALDGFHSETVDNATFSIPLDADGNVPGWQGWQGPSSIGYAFDSTYNANVLAVTTSAANQGVETVRKYACKPGDYVSATLDLYTDVGAAGAYFQIRFYKADGSLVAGINPKAQNSGFDVWETLTAGDAARAGSAYFTIIIYTFASSGRFLATNVRLSVNDVRVAGSRVKVGDQRNLPTVNFGNYGSAWAGLSFSYTATPTTATITASAATLWAGNNSIPYNSASVSVTGSAGTTKTFYLYYDDPNTDGGSQTLRATTSNVTATANDVRLRLGTATVTFPASGTGSGGGGSGPCPDENAWVLRADPDGVRADWTVRAGEVEVGHYLRLTDGRAGLVTYSQRKGAPRVRVMARTGESLTCSTSAPLELFGANGECVQAPESAGRCVSAWRDGHTHGAFIDRVEKEDDGWVQHITCENACFWTGDDPGYLFGHHNLKPG